MKLTLVVTPNGSTREMFKLHRPGCADIAKTLNRHADASATDFEDKDVDGIIRLASQDLYGTDTSIRRSDVTVVACAKEVR